MGLFNFLKKIKAEIPTVTTSFTVKELSSNSHYNDDIIPLKQRLNKAFKSSNGLYPHEILMLSYATSFKERDNIFQSFWKWNYSVLDPQAVLNSLFQRGFINRSDIKTTLCKLRACDLKELLAEKNLKVSGKKMELVERVLSNFDSEELEKCFTNRYFTLTALGENELKNNQYVIYLHRNKYMSVWEMNSLLNINNPNHLGYRDILWGEFNRLSIEHFKKFNFGLYRGVKFQMYLFLCEEKRYNLAMQRLIEVISFDLGGLSNNFDLSFLNKDIPIKTRCENRLLGFYTDNNNQIVLAPGIISNFKKLRENIALGNEEFIDYTYKEFSKIDVPYRVFFPAECANIVLSDIGLEQPVIENRYAVAAYRIQKSLRQ